MNLFLLDRVTLQYNSLINHLKRKHAHIHDDPIPA